MSLVLKTHIINGEPFQCPWYPYLRKKKSGRSLSLRTSATTYGNCCEQEFKNPCGISYQCFSPLFLCSSSRLSSRQWFHNEAVPLSWSSQSFGICPIKNRPHLLIRILNCRAGKPKATQAIEPMICYSNFSRFVLHPVNFVNNYTAPWESVEGINFPTREIKRGQDWEMSMKPAHHDDWGY